MRRPVSRRFAAVSSMVAGAAGVTANAALIGYYVLARPWSSDHSGPFEWLGPANDIIGSLSMAALIPVIGFIRQRMPVDRPLAGLSGAAILGYLFFVVLMGGVWSFWYFVMSRIGIF